MDETYCLKCGAKNTIKLTRAGYGCTGGSENKPTAGQTSNPSEATYHLRLFCTNCKHAYTTVQHSFAISTNEVEG